MSPYREGHLIAPEALVDEEHVEHELHTHTGAVAHVPVQQVTEVDVAAALLAGSTVVYSSRDKT